MTKPKDRLLVHLNKFIVYDYNYLYQILFDKHKNMENGKLNFNLLT